MTNQNKKVLVDERIHPVTVVVPGSQEVKRVGQVLTRIYEGENVQRHHFESTNGQRYNLGPTSNRFTFADHTAAMMPLIEQGYMVRDQVLSRGGTQLWTVLEPIERKEIQDPIHWDLEFWPTQSRLERTVWEAIIIKSSIKPGAGMSYNRGYFRRLCSNGLVDMVLGLGSVRFNHSNFAPKTVVSKLNHITGTNTMAEGAIKGNFIGTNIGAQRYADFLKKRRDVQEGEEVAIPYFVKDMLGPIDRLPKWYLESLIQQFEAMAGQEQSIHALDIINATTNSINLERASAEPRAYGRMVQRGSSIVNSSIKLVGAMSL